jgi:hypothetical protein
MGIGGLNEPNRITTGRPNQVGCIQGVCQRLCESGKRSRHHAGTTEKYFEAGRSISEAAVHNPDQNS